MTANTETAVLIVGAGPTGLTLACELARRGQAVRIIEQQAAPPHGSRGKGLQPRTLELFESLGVIEPLLARGAPYPRMRAHFGPFSWRWDMMERSEQTAEVPFPNPWLIPQADTEAVLRARLAELGVTVELGCALRGFTQDAGGVLATLEREHVRARYLVGADGGRSFVRRSLGLALHGRTLEEPSAVVGDLWVDGLDRAYWHVWPRARGGAVALCPLPGGEKFQLFAQLARGSAPPPLELSEVRAFVQRAVGRPKLAIRGASWLSLYQPQARMVDRYRVGRVFLAGDAAHLHPPTGGQGLNIGVQDAHNLGWKLAAVLAGAPATLLDSYEAERLPIARRVLELSSALYKRAAKQRRGKETKQLGTHYRESPLSLDDGGRAGVRAGDRAPDGITRDGRLFDLFRGVHFSVLAFGREAARIQPSDPRVRTYQVDDAKVFASYGATPDSVIVVRPDGYVGMRCDEPRAFVLDAYLARR